MKKVGKTPVVAVGLLHPCPIYDREVGKEQCQQQCSIISNNQEVCCLKVCRSPWRFCIACLRQGYKGHDAVVVDTEKGQCDFHKDHGPAARRSSGALASNGVSSNGNHSAKESFKVVGQVIEILTSRVQPFASQPRTYFDPVELASLKESVKRFGQISPGIVKPLRGNSHHDFELVDGQRRWIVCGDLGISFRAVVQSVTNVNDQFEISIAANFQRPDHTPLEISKAIQRLTTQNHRTLAQMAALFGKSLGWVNNHKKLIKLHPSIQALLEHTVPEDQRLAVTTAFQLADLSEEKQLVAFKEIKDEGLNATQARGVIRREGEKDGNKVGGKRGPQKDYEILGNYLRRVPNDARYFSAMTPDVFSGMFRHRKREDLVLTINKVEDSIRALTKLRESLSKIQVGK